MLKLNTPKPYYKSKTKIKTFVLGADPTNDEGVEFEYVFGINSGDRRYFAGIEKNLGLIGLGLKDVYVQNLIHEYLDEETSKNKFWNKSAELWFPVTKGEFDSVDPTKKIPVLVTAEKIMSFLAGKRIPAKDIYNGVVEMPLMENRLERPVFALYRHWRYGLERNEGYRGLLHQYYRG